MSETAQDAALRYARAAARVLPLHTPTPGGRRPCSCNGTGCKIGKHPRCRNGKDDATSDIDTVSRWWSMWPDANVGVRPHPGIVVVDVDPRHNGATSLLTLQRQYGPLPATQTTLTGGGGLHIWLAYDGPVKGKLALPGLDLKTNTGYLLMPPSLHESGQTYSWVNDTAGIQPAPGWLIELMTPATIPLPISTTNVATPARAESWLKVVREAEEGNRNHALFWAACKAAECGLDPAPLVAEAVAIGLTKQEALATTASAARQRGAA